MKKFIKIFTLISVCAAAVVGCDLTETQKATADKALIFGSETGLKAYTMSFYGMLPSTEKANRQDAMSDYLAKTSFEDFELGIITSENCGTWDWADIREVNYFLDNNTYTSVPEDVRNNYSGIALFFRALLYYDKLVYFGEVPWIGRVLNPGDPELTAPRDSRDVIIQHIIEDCDQAYQWIKSESSSDSQACLLNKYCAMLLKSRVCLFEASWRKYHAGTDYVKNCKITSDELFRLAAEAAEEVIKSGKFSLNTGTYKDGSGPYSALFSSDVVPTNEVMLAVAADTQLGAGFANYYFNVQETRPSLTRPFMNSYLNIDGTPYSEKHSNGVYKTFLEETTGRDLRLNQTIRAYDYKRTNANGVSERCIPNFSHSLTGYHVTKYTIPDAAYDVYGANNNDMPVMRYAEALLNYAEAKAELGTLTNKDWENTIGALRARAGITGGLTTKPTTIDATFRSTYFPKINDPVILEIRRERAIELCLEGFRMKDLRRWARADLWQSAKWTGVFIPGYDKLIDINGDGVDDVYFSNPTVPNVPADMAKYVVALNANVETVTVNGGFVLQYTLKGRVWNDRMYLDPICSDDILMNPNLTQNPGY